MRADAAFMRRALALARRGWGQVSPNPLVGCVVVREGAVVGAGWHRRYGGPHAEVHALREAGEAARSATAYVTLEPCNHHGKTPPCVDALLAAGVARVVVAVPDPNPVAAGGLARLRAAGVEVVVGVGAEASRELLAPFLFDVTGGGRPWVTLKLATSLDGAIADHTHGPGWLTGPEARREVHRLRAGHDAVAVGIGTALADDPELTVREGPPARVPPTRVVFDRGARLPVGGRLARTAGEVPVVVVCAPDAPRTRTDNLKEAGVRLVRAASLADGLAALRRELGLRSLLVEGGAGLASALWETEAVDRLVIIQAPVVLGAGALAAFAAAPGVRAGAARRLPVLTRRALGADLMTVLGLRPAPGAAAEASPP